MINFSQTNVVDYIKTHILCPMTSFENRAVCGIMWTNTADPDRRQMTIWRMRIAGYVPLTPHTHLDYVMPIPLPLQQRL
jgi:hypothetical protein